MDVDSMILNKLAQNDACLVSKMCDRLQANTATDLCLVPIDYSTAISPRIQLERSVVRLDRVWVPEVVGE